MTINYFEKELEKSQEIFNQTYGAMVISNIKNRQAVIVSIINLGLLCRKITTAERKHEMKHGIQTFMRIRNTLNNHFKKLIERGHHETNSGHQGQPDIETCNGRRGGNRLQEMREHVLQYLAEGGR